MGIAIFSISVAFSADALATESKGDEKAPEGYQLKSMQGWRVLIKEELLKQDPNGTAKALELTEAQLKEIVRTVPEAAVAELRKITLWFSPEYEGIPPRAEYHPDRSWLRANRRNPDMAKGVEITNVRIFEAECQRMPCFILHELAHGYHDRVLGFEQPEIIAAYKHARENKLYEKVARFNGPKRPNTTERAYAMTNHKEYFAEQTEAFFGRNDFFPFTRDELEKHDPEMFKLLERLWNLPAKKEK
ncbi:MAG TPA: hypothetical protein VKX17_09180 [Planctomycetota bacterium]|nr:hypothetical protein [Planctomycetota bacterium]